VNRRLFTVGPVEVREELVKAMSKPMIIHRGKEYKKLHENIVEKTRKVLDTDMEILFVGSSATGLLEGCSRCGVRSKALGMSNGSFGKRWQEISESNGKTVIKAEAPWGEPIMPEHFLDSIDGSVDAVHFVSNESSTGVLNPTADIVDAIKERSDALVMVDGVTAVAGTDLKLRSLDIDALVFGTQKALALPPGIALAACSEPLLERSKDAKDAGYYFNLNEIHNKNTENYALTTPPVSLMYGLDAQLDRMLAEGMPARYRRHQEMKALVHSWAEGRDGLYAQKGFRSDTISVINKGDMPFDTFHSALKEKGYEISNGYGKIKDTTFRIGHMGDLTVADIKELIEKMDETLEEIA